MSDSQHLHISSLAGLGVRGPMGWPYLMLIFCCVLKKVEFQLSVRRWSEIRSVPLGKWPESFPFSGQSACNYICMCVCVCVCVCIYIYIYIYLYLYSLCCLGDNYSYQKEKSVCIKSRKNFVVQWSFVLMPHAHTHFSSIRINELASVSHHAE